MAETNPLLPTALAQAPVAGHAPEPPLAEQTAAARDAEPGRSWALPVAVVVMAAGAADAVTTAMALDTGRAVEANPVIAALQSALGPGWVACKLALHAALATLTIWWPSRPTLIAIAAVSLIIAGVSAHNFGLYLELAD